MWWDAGLPAGDDPVWEYPGRVVTRDELGEEVPWHERMLRAHGIRPGDTVALSGEASFTQLWSVLALWSAGAQVMLLAPGLTVAERDAAIRVARPSFLITTGADRRPRGRFPDHCEVLVRRLPGGRRATGDCLAQFSSGTTGTPKLVGRTAASLTAELARFAAAPGMPGRGETVALLEPYTHSFGLIGGVLHALRAGAVVSFPADGSAAARRAAVLGADVALGNPEHYAELVTGRERSKPRRLRAAFSSGDTLAPEVYTAFRRRYGVPIGQAYGTTETGVLAADPRGTPDGRTVGAPLPGVAVRVAAGVLEVRTDGGWVSTGDLVDAEPGTGVLRLRGRAGDPRTAGIDLVRVEGVLRDHDEVVDAVVLGVEPIEAHVVTRSALSQAELSSWCRRFVGDTAAPRRYHFVRRLPRTSNGKVLRDRSRLLLPSVAAGRDGDERGPDL